MLKSPAHVWRHNQEEAKPRRHNSFYGSKPTCTNCPNKTGVSELLAAANAATQALADKLASVVPAVDLAGGSDGNDVDTEAGAREAASKRGPAELDDTQMDEQLEKWADNYGLDTFRAVSQVGKRTRTAQRECGGVTWNQSSHKILSVLRWQALCSRPQIETKPPAPPSLEGAALLVSDVCECWCSG